MSAPPPAPAGQPHSPGAAWQSAELAASFAERRRILVPLLDVQEEVLALVLSRGERPIGRFLDLGCGAGGVSELVLGTQPGSEGVLVDFSEPMLERAAAQLAAFDGRWRAVRGDLNDPSWPRALPDGRYDAVVSGLAIHHVPAERKRALFAEALALLEPGGLFVNMDYVAIEGPLRGLFDERMRANAVAHEHAGGGTRSAEEVDVEDDDDRPDSVEDQLRWLREAGFEQVEVHFKWAEAAIYGGMKPAQGARPQEP
ncbi:MAG TPA: class I SAM-dependent methyltransferase [Solirubrobacteraceae bacterium]|nr:class I SAM-dependent methyltransferase [Solirubrobacteraceae bacterium]